MTQINGNTQVRAGSIGLSVLDQMQLLQALAPKSRILGTTYALASLVPPTDNGGTLEFPGAPALPDGSRVAVVSALDSGGNAAVVIYTVGVGGVLEEDGFDTMGPGAVLKAELGSINRYGGFSERDAFIVNGSDSYGAPSVRELPDAASVIASLARMPSSAGSVDAGPGGSGIVFTGISLTIDLSFENQAEADVEAAAYGLVDGEKYLARITYFGEGFRLVTLGGDSVALPNYALVRNRNTNALYVASSGGLEGLRQSTDLEGLSALIEKVANGSSSFRFRVSAYSDSNSMELTLDRIPESDSETVIVNGLVLAPQDYTLSGVQLSIPNLSSGDSVVVTYQSTRPVTQM